MSHKISRRQMIKQVSAGAALVVVGSQQSVQAETSATIKSTKVISYQPDKYHGWPTLAQRKNGELLLVCSGGQRVSCLSFWSCGVDAFER